MVAYVTYVAQRGIVSGHAEGVGYALDFETSDVQQPSGNDIKEVQESISGVVETNFYGERLIWTITTIPVQRSSEHALLLREFLRSTADGQQFTLDPYGVEEDEGPSMDVVREDKGFTRERFQEIDGPSDYERYTFTVREV
jgi:hypothetical protein